MFKDVPHGYWAKDAIEFIANEGIATKQEFYRPNDPTTRAEMAVFMQRLMKKE
jgi:hypothetical protein